MNNSDSVRSVEGKVFTKITILDDKKKRYCNVCGKEGKHVLPVTISTHIDVKYWHLITDSFYFCFTEDCPIIYFDNYNNIYFSKDEVKTKFGPKEKESPRPICYCLQVRSR